MIRSLWKLGLVGCACVCAAQGGAAGTAPKITVDDEGPYLETAEPGIKLSGYVDAGYTYNFLESGGRNITGRSTSNSNKGGDFDLNAVRLYLEKALPEENKLAAGFFLDVAFGEDSQDYPNVLGAGTSSDLAVRNAYVQIKAPLGNGLEIAVGKFGALIGYEAEERPANLNITYGFVSTIDPADYTGARFLYAFNETVDVGFSIGNTNGSDNGLGIDGNSDEYALSGFVNINAPGGNANIQTGFHYSPWGDSGYGTLENEPVVVLNMFGNWAPTFANDKLLLAFNTSLGLFNDFQSPAPTPADDSSTWFGLALYAKYQFTDIFSLAGRAEYVHGSDDNINGLGLASNDPAADQDIWSWTATAGFNLADNLLLRAEYRVDFGSNILNDGAGNATLGNTAHTLATQVVYSF